MGSLGEWRETQVEEGRRSTEDWGASEGSVEGREATARQRLGNCNAGKETYQLSR